jgi:hypothetical protein
LVVLAPLLKRLSVTESCTAELAATSISWEATEVVVQSEEDHGILAICGKYKVSHRSVFRFKSY